MSVDGSAFMGGWIIKLKKIHIKTPGLNNTYLRHRVFLGVGLLMYFTFLWLL